MLKEAKENIKENTSKDLIKKTSTYNNTFFKRNLNKAKLRSLQKNSLTLLNHIIQSDDKELIILKQKLLENEDLKNDNNAVNLIYLIHQLNGAIPKTYFDIKDPNNDALYVTKQIYNALQEYNLFYFFFCHYKIEEKSIIKLIPLMGYQYYEKNSYIFKEGDNSSRMYFILKGKISFSKKINSLEFDEAKDVEQYKMGEGKYFGEWDLVFGRKTKLSALCLENCYIIFIGKEAFQKYIQEKFTKTESDTKNNLINILNKYMFMPQVKLERFVGSEVKIIFFRKSEIIYNEGEENRYLYLIYDGEANLLKNITTGENHSLITNSFDDIKIEAIQKKAKKINYKELIMEPLHKNNNNNSLKLDLILNKSSYKIVATLGKGSFAGLEIVTGVSNFKYSLISNSNFTSVYKINLKYLEEHLKEFMLNLMPLFFDLEEKIHRQIENIKYIDYNIIPNSFQKYKNENKVSKYLGFDTDENDETFIKQIKKIENKFDINEGGFIKMNKKNINLHKKRNILKDQLKENKLKDQQINRFVRNYEKEQLANLKYKKVRLIHSAKNKTNKILNKNNSFLCNASKNRPMSSFANKVKNMSVVLKETKENTTNNLSKSIIKSTNNSIFTNRRKNFNLFYKEEMEELQNEMRKKTVNKNISVYKIPKTKLTVNKIKESLSIDSKDLVKKVFIRSHNNFNKSHKNIINYKIKSSMFPKNNNKYRHNYMTININRNKNENRYKKIKNVSNNVNDENILNILKTKKYNLKDEQIFKKYNFYDTGIFDMPLAVQLGVN